MAPVGTMTTIYDAFRPSEKSIILPALERFEAFQAKHDLVPLWAFYPDDLGKGSDYALLVEMVGVRIDVRYQYVGWKLQHVYGQDATGLRATTALPKSYADDAMASYRRAVLTRQPQLEYRKISAKGWMPFRYRRLMLPLSEDGSKITHVLVYILPTMWWIRSRYDLALKRKRHRETSL